MKKPAWHSWQEPERILRFLRSRVSDRKIRLFAVACLRQIWPILAYEPSRVAVEVAEQFADGLVSDETRAAAAEAASREWFTAGSTEAAEAAAEKAAVACAAVDQYVMYWDQMHSLDHYYASVVSREVCDVIENACIVHAQVEEGAAYYDEEDLRRYASLFFLGAIYTARVGGITQVSLYQDDNSVRRFVKQTQCRLLRDIVGGPPKDNLFDPGWRSRTATALAARMYDERDFAAMPVLADALQDAGCEVPDILDHCRNGGEHVRGCWVVDLVLGKA